MQIKKKKKSNTQCLFDNPNTEMVNKENVLRIQGSFKK